jgi:hypothetical protein
VDFCLDFYIYGILGLIVLVCVCACESVYVCSMKFIVVMVPFGGCDDIVRVTQWFCIAEILISVRF